MNSLVDYVVNGRFRELSVGMSRQEVLELLGEPKDWAGSGGFSGVLHASFKESRVWRYYRGCAGIGFGENNEANLVIIYPEQASDFPELFTGWPTMRGLKMRQWAAALKKNNIPFRESRPKPYTGVHWIIAAETCEVHGYVPGVARRSQKIEMIVKYSSVREMDLTFRR